MHDLPAQIGPYRPLALLGQGGMGVVYLCEHVDTADRVAVKTLRGHDGYRMISIRREMQALSALDHPGVVRFIDRGVHGGLPWYAMELVYGVSLRRLLHPPRTTGEWEGGRRGPRAGGGMSDTGRVRHDIGYYRGWGVSLASCVEEGLKRGSRDGRKEVLAEVLKLADARPRLPLDRALDIICRLCWALAYVHGQGIVHRDLKPDNIIVRSDGRPVLVDFGLTAFYSGGLGRETVDGPSGLGGTVAYMAPEQIRGEFVDARADLYALGCILYEIVAGRPPFGGEHTTVLESHERERPQAPAAMGEDVPEPLSDLTLRLLAKQPSDRLGYAEDVGKALLRMGANPGVPAPPPQNYLYRPRLAGRAQAFGLLSAMIEEQKGAVALVTGEAGIGKTRLAAELISEAERNSWRVWTGVCTPIAEGTAMPAIETCPPLHPLRPLLVSVADACVVRGPVETGRLLGAACRILAPYESSLSAVPGFAGYGKPEPLPLNEARHRLFSSLTEVIGRLTKEGPVLLVLDDLHWADELTLGWLEHLAISESLAEIELVVIGLARSGERVDALQALSKPAAVVPVPLERLDEAAVEEMISSMLAMPSPPPGFVTFLVDQSEGNPFFVAEYLRTAVARGLLARGDDGRWQVADPAVPQNKRSALSDLPLPRGLQALLREHVASTSSGARQLLQGAAVLGMVFDPMVLVGVLQVDELELEPFLDRLEELRRRDILRPVEATARWQFVHGRLAEVVYADLEAARRTVLHALAAEALSAEGQPALSGELATIARHLELAERTEEASSTYFAAAEAALDAYALDESRRLFTAGLRLVATATAESVSVRATLAERVLAPRGDLEEGLRNAQLALDEAVALGDGALEALALRAKGLVLTSIGRLDEALEAYEAALARDTQLGRAPEQGIDMSRVATVLNYQGRLEKAGDFFQRALSIHERVGNEIERCKVLINLGMVRRQLGDLAVVEPLYEEALSVSRALNLRNLEGIALNNLAILYRQRGQLARALELYRQALEALERVGDRVTQSTVLSNIGHVELHRGHLEAAEEPLRRALQMCRSIGNRRTETLVYTNLGERAYLLGDLEEAERLLERGRALALRHGVRRSEALVLSSLTDVKSELGYSEEAMPLVQRARELASLGGFPRLLACADATYSRLMRRRGQTDGLVEMLTRARRSLRHVDARGEEGLIVCELGQLATTRDEAEAYLQQARAIAGDIDAGPRSRLGREIQALRTAIGESLDAAP